MRDPAKDRAKKARYIKKKHDDKYGPGVGDMRGKHGNHARGDKNGRWNESKIISDEGYSKLRVGTGHPLADPNGYAYEHIVIWVSAGHPIPGDDETVHHINEAKTDNRIENLRLMTRSGHAKMHDDERVRDHLGRFREGA